MKLTRRLTSVANSHNNSLTIGLQLVAPPTTKRMTSKSARKTATTSSSVWGIILASSQPGEFSAEIEPVFLTLGSKPVLTYSLSAFERCPDVEGLVLVAAKNRLDSVRSLVHLFGCNKVKAIIPGFASRWESVQAGLAVVAEHRAGTVVVHEGARPGVTPEMIAETIRLARKCGAASVAQPVTEPIVESAKGVKITGAPEGEQLFAMATPQAFRSDVLQKILANAVKKKLKLADEAIAAHALKQEVQLVSLKRPMVRVDSPIDLNLAEFYLKH